MPVRERELARDDRRTTAIAILHHLEEIVPLRFARRPETEVVEDEDVGLRETREQLRIGSVGVSKSELGPRDEPLGTRRPPSEDASGLDAEEEDDRRGDRDEDLTRRNAPPRRSELERACADTQILCASAKSARSCFRGKK